MGRHASGVVRRPPYSVEPTGIRLRRPLHRRVWRWEEIAAVSWADEGRFGCRLVLCLVGDAYPRVLQRVWFLADARKELERIRAALAPHGVGIENRDEPANYWWWTDPRSRRG